MTHKQKTGTMPVCCYPNSWIFLYNSFCFSVGFFGITIFTLAFKSPNPSSFLGKPKFLSRKDCPEEVPSGILILILPCGVSISFCTPKTASGGVISISCVRLSPSTV